MSCVLAKTIQRTGKRFASVPKNIFVAYLDEFEFALVLFQYRYHAYNTTTAATTKHYPTKWGWLHELNYAIMFYHNHILIQHL